MARSQINTVALQKVEFTDISFLFALRPQHFLFFIHAASLFKFFFLLYARSLAPPPPPLLLHAALTVCVLQDECGAAAKSAGGSAL